MIRSFRHKRLERFFRTGKVAGIPPSHIGRLRLVLGRLNAATSPADMDLPGLRLHQLSGREKGRWSVKVSGNWRLTFRFDGPEAVHVDYEDYH